MNTRAKGVFAAVFGAAVAAGAVAALALATVPGRTDGTGLSRVTKSDANDAPD